MKRGPPTDPVQLCWFRQSRTEYTAAALTAEMCHWLVQLGVRPDLLIRNTRLVADEVRHAALSHELYLHAGGEPRQVGIQQGGLAHADDLGAAVALRAITAAGELACEESVALPVFRTRLRNATDPKAKEVIEIILRDEATHRAFAWDTLDELVVLLGHDTVRAWVRPRIAFWLRVYLRASLEDQVRPYTPAQLGMGLIDRREHWTLMRACVADTVIPRFQKRDLLEADVGIDDLVRELEARP